MDFKLVGSILLIVGTSIGAGMLALPIATAQLGFLGSLILLFGCWFIMTMGALLLLEVNLWMPMNSNLITMARATIGPVGQIISWITYLLLLYSLLCAYIAGGSDLFHNLLMVRAIDIPHWASSIIFTVIFGSVVFMGIRSVDYVNRGLMFVKFGAYFLLVILLIPFISSVKLMAGEIHNVTSATAITVTITSFGYAAIVPSLRVYFAGDIKKLKKAILIGSLIPLLCYIAWDAAIMGVIPLAGENGLMAILQSKTSTSDLVNTLSATASSNSVTFFTKLFTSICVLTSFLGVALCLADFLADGFQVEKKGVNNLFVHVVTFLPPLVIVLFYPSAFISALEYAGIYCIILLILLPAWMAWRGRYRKRIANGYRVPGGKALLAVLIIFSLVLIARGVTG
ncbi:amino acid permease [Aquicella lusitana]|uniref:Tyrosine-specific transport protein n=1 Tax=Aquicella lusitana TaxID=254246 RepID=A0A370GGK5_9COXI|nr:aromatic amino acid transport family protein [Aquicella lusitana]RDI41514.1 tyrosine-specific transport protein [Aquicella lusitana]VVC72592.1 Tyrosine-specific transport protein [Aquicella lusitana]